MEVLSPGSHYCPKSGCAKVVPNRLFACRGHWYDLPRAVRARVYATASLPISNPERAAVFADARAAWGESSIHTS